MGAHESFRLGTVWDNDACMPLPVDDSFLPQIDRYLKSGVSVASRNVGMAYMPSIEDLRVLSFMRQWVTPHPDPFRLVATVHDVRRCKAEGKLGIVFDVEGMYPVQDDLSFVQKFY